MNPGVTEEVSRNVGSFMEIMKMQPLSLALVVMNFLLVAFLFYSGAQTLDQRTQMAKEILNWTQRTDTLLASCVSLEVTKLMLDNMQRITETMLSAEQREIQRMQAALLEERDRYQRLQMFMTQQGIKPPEQPPLPEPRPQSERHILFAIPQ